MTWPKQYGGHERTAFERYVLIEEMLAAGAPLSAPLDRRPAERPEHPALRHRGAEGLLPAAHRRRRTVVLHRHERAEFRLRSRRHAHPRGEGRWRLPHQRQQAVDLERASRRLHDPVLQDGRRRAGGGGPPRRRDAVPAGPENSPGIEIRPVINLLGEHHFNEIFLTDVFVPDNRLFGEDGNGWNQVTSELRSNAARPTASWCCSSC